MVAAMTGFNSKRDAAADKLQEPVNEREVLKLALEALESLYISPFTMPDNPIGTAITAIKAALAQPVQEPVAWIWKDMRGQDVVSLFEPRFNSIPLYTTPPKRPWVGLTDEEIHGTPWYNETHKTYQFALSLIAKLKERNS